jgi:very-short-patch-repair endonuclease
MIIYFLIGAIVLAIILILAIKNLRSDEKLQDSALKQRAIFTANEQIAFTRLKETLPMYTVLAHVSFDALITTKFYHTRNKYRHMVADFVIVNEHQDVIGVVSMDDHANSKRSKNIAYRDELLKMAGYRVFHFDHLPNTTDFSEIFKNDLLDYYQESGHLSVSAPKHYGLRSPLELKV